MNRSPTSDATAPHDGEAEHRPVPVLVNTASGLSGADRTLQLLQQAARDCEYELDLRPTAPPQLTRALQQVAGEGAGVVGVCGGDGSLVTAASALAGGERALAVFPGGTMNHFARRLGLGEFSAAVRAAKEGVVSTAPIGIVDDNLFLNTATFGFYADVVRRRERLRKWLRKWPAAAVGFAEMFLRMNRFRMTLQVEGETLHRTTPLVWVGMGWGSFPRVIDAAERRSRPDLEIVVLRPRSRLGMLRLTARLARHLRHEQRPIEDPGLEVLHARSLIIHSRRPISATIDGEVVDLEPPIFIGIVDQALRVVVPADD